MKNIALDGTAVLQLDADGTDGALDAAEDLRWTLAFDVADDRHSGANTRAWHRIRSRLPHGRRLFDDRVLLLHGPPHDFGHICRRVLILLRCFALEHVNLHFAPAFTGGKAKASARHWTRD